jgi:hypothetical protein
MDDLTLPGMEAALATDRAKLVAQGADPGPDALAIGVRCADGVVARVPARRDHIGWYALDGRCRAEFFLWQGEMMIYEDAGFADEFPTPAAARWPSLPGDVRRAVVNAFTLLGLRTTL